MKLDDYIYIAINKQKKTNGELLIKQERAVWRATIIIFWGRECAMSQEKGEHSIHTARGRIDARLSCCTFCGAGI